MDIRGEEQKNLNYRKHSKESGSAGINVAVERARQENRDLLEVFRELLIHSETGCWRSATETVEGSTLSLESVDDIESGDGLPAGVFGVGDGISDNVLEESSEDRAGLLVDVRADSLDTTSSGESADSGLGDAHDGLSDSLLGASLGSVFATLSFSSDLSFASHNYENLLCI